MDFRRFKMRVDGIVELHEMPGLPQILDAGPQIPVSHRLSLSRCHQDKTSLTMLARTIRARRVFPSAAGCRSPFSPIQLATAARCRPANARRRLAFERFPAQPASRR
jgi:hypothetical protein